MIVIPDRKYNLEIILMLKYLPSTERECISIFYAHDSKYIAIYFPSILISSDLQIIFSFQRKFFQATNLLCNSSLKPHNLPNKQLL